MASVLGALANVPAWAMAALAVIAIGYLGLLVFAVREGQRV